MKKLLTIATITAAAVLSASAMAKGPVPAMIPPTAHDLYEAIGNDGASKTTASYGVYNFTFYAHIAPSDNCPKITKIEPHAVGINTNSWDINNAVLTQLQGPKKGVGYSEAVVQKPSAKESAKICFTWTMHSENH